MSALQNGIWLPMECATYVFAGAQDPPSVRGKVKLVNSVFVDKLSINDVSDDELDIHYEPGTLIMDLGAQKSYTVPAGEHLLEKAISDGSAIVNGVEGRPQPRTRSRYGIFIMASMGIMFFLIVVIASRSKLKKKHD
jgi:hypothetical protein